MANRYPDHSDDEAPRSRCSSRSDRESDSDADRARREQASDAARWSRGLLKTGDQRAAPSRGLPIITFTLILLMCAAFLQQQELTILFKKDRWWHLRRWWYPFPFLFLRHMSSLHLAANVFALFQFGSVVEPAVGKARMLAVYVLSGAAGCLALQPYRRTWYAYVWEQRTIWEAWHVGEGPRPFDLELAVYTFLVGGVGAPTAAVLGVGGVMLALNRRTLWTPFGVRKPHDIRVMLWVNVAVNVLLCEWVEAKLLYSDDRDYSGCGPRPLTRPTPGCPRRVERRARYAAHAGGLLAGAALGYFLCRRSAQKLGMLS